MYPTGLGRLTMKSFGNRSSASSGSMNTFANGVAVYPTYCALGNSLRSCPMALFVLVRSPFFTGFSWSIVLTEA